MLNGLRRGIPPSVTPSSIGGMKGYRLVRVPIGPWHSHVHARRYHAGATPVLRRCHAGATPVLRLVPMPVPCPWQLCDHEADFPPDAESLDECTARLLPFVSDELHPSMAAAIARAEAVAEATGDEYQVPVVMVVASENVLRGLVKQLEGLSDEAIPLVDVPYAVPLVYQVGYATRLSTLRSSPLLVMMPWCTGRCLAATHGDAVGVCTSQLGLVSRRSCQGQGCPTRDPTRPSDGC